MSSVDQPSTAAFHRKLLARLFPISIPFALAAVWLFPFGPNLIIAFLVMSIGGVIFLVPYKSDMVIFFSNGDLSVGQRSLRPEDCSACRYRRVVPTGRMFRASGFALYAAEDTSGLPHLFIPCHGWLRADKVKLFRRLAAWLVDSGIDLSSDDHARIADYGDR